MDGLLARATNTPNWAVEEGYCESAFAVSGQTRIHLESSARGAVRVLGAQIQNNTVDGIIGALT